MIKAIDRVDSLTRLDDIGSDRDSPILLDKNERTVPYPEIIYRELIQTLKPTELIKYPDQLVLYKKLSNFLGLEIEHLLLTNGADSGLKSCFETFVEPGDEIVCLTPTYAMIMVYAQMFGSKVRQVGYNVNLELDLDLLFDCITKRTKIVILPNPNQPTGTLIDSDTIHRLLSKTETLGVLLVLDEAYIEFSGADSALSLVSKHTNLCVLRTFSKAWGLAGVRLGYLAGPTTVISNLKKVKPLLDINVLALKAASFFIDRYYLIEDYTLEIQHSRQQVLSDLSSHGLKCIPSFANFIHICLPTDIDSSAIIEQLLDSGYRVRSVGGTASILDGCIRITIGPRKQMKDFSILLINIINKQ